MAPGQQLHYKLGARRINRASLSEVPSADESKIHEYKKCMEKVKCENPHLSVGAQRQMTLEQCAKTRKEQEEGARGRQRRFTVSDANELFRGMMTKFHLGGQSSFESNVGPTTQASGFSAATERRRFTVAAGGTHKSLAPCQSVRRLPSEQQNKLPQLDWNECDNNSLENSLNDIEKSIHIQSNNSMMKYNRRRSSGLTLDSGVGEEDEESEDSDTEDNEFHNHEIDKSENHPAQKNNQESTVDFHPDEIAVALGNFEGLNDEENNVLNDEEQEAASRGQGRRKGRGNRHNIIKSNTKSHRSYTSNNSSFLSVDSADFEGDFWAWRSSSADAPSEDEENLIHENKKCIEEVKSENLDLSIGGQRQVALERGAPRGMRSMVPDNLLRGVMTKLHLGRDCGFKSPEQASSSTTVDRDGQRSLAPEQQNNFSAQRDWIERQNESLENCLEDSEKSSIAKPIGSSSRYGRMPSGLSSDPLSDVEEDGESKDSSHSEEKRAHPDEIVLALGDKKAASPSQERRKGRRSRHHQRSIKSSMNSNRSNHDSSFASADSANFAGDFSAWRSFSSRSTRSS